MQKIKFVLLTIFGLLCYVPYGYSQTASEVQEIQQKAEQGDAEAQYKLADLYLSGEGVPQDQSKVLEWLNKSANQGNQKAQGLLGFIYVKNDQVSEGISWFEKSANQGNVNAAGQLGNIYYNQKDYDKAKNWLLDAASLGDADAQFLLGVMYFNGEGVARSFDKSVAYAKVACENKNSKACQFYQGLTE